MQALTVSAADLCLCLPQCAASRTCCGRWSRSSWWRCSCPSIGRLQAVHSPLSCAKPRVSRCSFEDMLREAESEELVASRAAGKGGGGSPLGPDLALLRRPRVFTLAIVWESPQVCRLWHVGICSLCVWTQVQPTACCLTLAVAPHTARQQSLVCTPSCRRSHPDTFSRPCSIVSEESHCHCRRRRTQSGRRWRRCAQRWTSAASSRASARDPATSCGARHSWLLFPICGSFAAAFE